MLKSIRNLDYSDSYQHYFTLGSVVSTRDGDAIHETFSVLKKLLYLHDRATPTEIEAILRFVLEGRKRVKDQIVRIDTTMTAAKLGYNSLGEGWSAVTTLEEDEYPFHYHSG